MNEDIKGILHRLNKKSELVFRIEQEFIDILDRPQELNLFIEKLKEELRLEFDPQGKHSPFYYFYIAAAYQTLNDGKQAKAALARAVHIFRIKDFFRNEALGEWFFALIHLANGDIIRAERACETALSIMRRRVDEIRGESHYAEADECTSYIVQLEKLLNTINTTPPVKVEENLKPSRSTEEDYMVLPWFLKYESVQAGPNGLIWGVPPTENSTAIHMVEIDGKLCEIFSLISSTKAQNHQITLIRGAEYGWAKVKGHSMNAHKPMAIEENDYVLFTNQWHPDQDAIVIAGQSLTNSELSYMVKKYIAKDRLLISETTDTSQDYPPIQINEECQIMGTVIAVAKPRK